LEHLIETSRQFTTLIGRVGHEKPIDSKFVLRRLEVDLPLALPSDDVRLEWVRRRPKGRAFDIAMRLYHPSGEGLDAEVGSASFDTLIVNPNQYQSIRFGRPRAEERAQ
jgi:hypothetical protein